MSLKQSVKKIKYIKQVPLLLQIKPLIPIVLNQKTLYVIKNIAEINKNRKNLVNWDQICYNHNQFADNSR